MGSAATGTLLDTPGPVLWGVLAAVPLAGAALALTLSAGRRAPVPGTTVTDQL